MGQTCSAHELSTHNSMNMFSRIRNRSSKKESLRLDGSAKSSRSRRRSTKKKNDIDTAIHERAPRMVRAAIVTEDECSQYSGSTTATAATRDTTDPLTLVTTRHSTNRAAESVSSNRNSRKAQFVKSYQKHHEKRSRNSPSIDDTYQILPQVTATGVAGQVRHCIHIPTNEVCAVKTISKSHNKHSQSRIRREVAFLQEVDHPNIISLYDVYEENDLVHIVTELCNGGELFDKIVTKAKLSKMQASMDDIDGERVSTLPSCFDEKSAARIIRSMLSAVSYLHQRDIVHRDIKPENILFTEKDNEHSTVKLIDFGLSIRHPPQCKPLTSKVGTSYYMSPELLDGSYDRGTDMWSVGVLTYVLLTGRPPFNGPTNDIIFHKIRHGRFRNDGCSYWDVLSEEAKDFVRCLLVMDPKKRWTADMALGHPWFKMVAKFDEDDEHAMHLLAQ